jgi:histone H3/H4
MARDVYVVQSKVRALAKKKGFRFSSEALDALSERIADAVSQAAVRAKANKRHTIKGCDI